MKILFINPSSMPYKEQEDFLNKSSILRVPSFSMPIGLMDMSAYLRQSCKDVEIKILDIGKDLYSVYLDRKNVSAMSLPEFVKERLDVIDFKPDIVGISVLFSSSHKVSMLIAEMVKKKWEETVVLCGGNHATNSCRQILKKPCISYVVKGEGELSFTEFVKRMQCGEKDIKVHGIIDREKLKNVGSGELSHMIQDLDELPFPAFDLLDLEFYRETIGGSLMFSRGCSFLCTFCASHTVHGRKMRFKSEERISKEFEYLIDEHKFKQVVIEDDLFAARKDKFLRIAKKLAKSYASTKFLMPQGLSMAILDEEIIDAMINMGIDEAAIAIESGSEYVQKNIIKKNVSLSKTGEILKCLRGKKFLFYVNFILGFPGETRELMEETIDFMKTLDVDWVYIFHALPLPGSEIFEQFTSMGIIDPDNFDWDGMRLGRRVFDTPEITAEGLETLIYDTNIECNFFDNSNLKNGRYERAIELFDRFIIAPYPFHIVGRYCRALAYLGMGETQKAETDLKKCVDWIQTNDESKRLYDRYGDKMVHLKQYCNI